MDHVYRCGNCGAQLDPTPGEREMRCAFCEAVTVKEAPPPPKKQPRKKDKKEKRSEPAEEPRSEAKRPRKDDGTPLMGYVATLGPLLAALISGGYFYFRTERSWTGEPIVADVDGDGTEDVVGQWTAIEKGDHTSVLGLVDGKSSGIVWSLTLDAKRGSSAVFPMALADGLVVVSGPEPGVQIVDARSGKVSGTVFLPSKVSGIQAKGGLAWVETDVGKSVLVDLRAARAMPSAPKPDWVDERSCPRATCRSSSAAPPVVDMKVDGLRLEPGSDTAVAIGTKENGTHLPMLAGVSLAKKSVRWTHIFGTPATNDGGAPQHVTVARGRAFFEYESANEKHIAAVSVETGQVLWDVSRGEWRSATSIVAGTRVHVTTSSKLLVLDASTGATVAKLF